MTLRPPAISTSHLAKTQTQNANPNSSEILNASRNNISQRVPALLMPCAKNGKTVLHVHPQQQQSQQNTPPQLMEQPHQPVTPAVWLVVWVSMTFGFLQALAFRLSSSSLSSPHFQATFWGLDLFVADTIASTAHQQHQLLDWCPARNSLRATWILPAQTLCGAAGRLLAAWLSSAAGRRSSIWVGSALALAGVLLQATAWQLAQFVVGCCCVGIGIGFMYQAVLLEDIEIAPAKHRGLFASLWQLGDKAGAAVATGLYSYAPLMTAPYGWRLALSAALWPALAILLVLPWLPETPNSLIQRGLLEQGRDSLRRIRGPFYSREALAAEANAIWKASGFPIAETSRWKRTQWVTRQMRQLFSRDQQPMLLLVSLLTVFAWLQDLVSKQLLGGVLTLESVISLQITLTILPAAANAAGCLLVDRWGRKPLLLSGAVIGLATSTSIVCVCALLGDAADQRALVAMHAVSVTGLGWAWPAWAALTSEHFSLASRSAGIAVVSSLGALFQALAHGFEDDVACHLKWGILLMKTACCLGILVLVALLLPEVKGVPLERVSEVWHKHWIWKAWYALPSSQRQRQQQLPDGEAALSQVMPWNLDVIVRPAVSDDDGSVLVALH